MLIGTATTRFKSLEDADRAFFDLFRLVELGPLTAKECAALWNMATRQNLAAREIRPFEILTGGSPRLLVLLAGVGHQLTLKQLLADMVGLIDEHTEYFRQCLESLPSGERRVFLALADLWEPAPASVIADRARYGHPYHVRDAAKTHGQRCGQRLGNTSFAQVHRDREDVLLLLQPAEGAKPTCGHSKVHRVHGGVLRPVGRNEGLRRSG